MEKMPKAKPILTARKEGGYDLDVDNLKSILLADDVRNKPVIVISVAGAFRKGKSFLLNMMIRYFTASNKSAWLDGNNLKNSGFPWKGGYKRHTTGILMWEKPLPVTLPSGEEAVIILMDTQGTFDSDSTVEESSTVFAMSTMLSSLQIFNLQGNLQNDDLEHLQLFTEYGRMALEESEVKPFQKLLFLVRDWEHTDQLALGAKGGNALVKDWLAEKSGKKELKDARSHINDCFTDISGFLLPYPGKVVARGMKLEMTINDMDPEFATGLTDLMSAILSPENLSTKMMANNSVKALDLFHLFKTYFGIFSNGDLPKPKNILNATAEANNMAAVQDARSQYIKDMEFLALDEQKSLEPRELFKKHKEAVDKAVGAFKARKKMGDRAMAEEHLQRLVMDTEQWFSNAEQMNNLKREKEKTNAKQHNINVGIKCEQFYVKEMETVSAADVGHVSQNDIENSHRLAKEKAMEKYDHDKDPFPDADKESKDKLIENIDMELRKILVLNQLKKEAQNQEEMEANMKAVSLAKQTYCLMMNKLTNDDVLTTVELHSGHIEAVQSAVERFESLKKGDEAFAVTFLETMKDDLDRELDNYFRVNENKKEISDLKDEVSTIRDKLKESESSGGCTIQ